MNKLETLRAGDDVWHLDNGRPRCCEYVGPHGRSSIEARFHGIPQYLDCSQCYAVRAECYAMAAWQAVEEVTEKLQAVEGYLAVMAEEISGKKD